MTLDEAIKHCEEVAETKRQDAEDAEINGCDNFARDCEECANEHRQLAEWLRKYQKIQEIISDFREYQKGISCGFGGVTYMQMISEVVEDGNDEKRST